MELKFTNAERKSIASGNMSESAAQKIENKLPGFDVGHVGLTYKSPQNVSSFYDNMFKLPAQYQQSALHLTVRVNPNVRTPMNQSKNPNPTKPASPVTINGVTENAGTGAYGSKQPTQSDAMAASIGPWFALGAWAGGGVLEGIGRIKSADEHLADAGTSQTNINGISYTQQNAVNSGSIMSEYDSNTVKDFLTNPFRGIASIFGRSKAKREAELALNKAIILQEGAKDEVYDKYLRQDFAKKYGNQEDQVLFAKNGKLPKFDVGKVATALGEMIAEPNAKVSNGEVIAREVAPDQFTYYRVPGPKNNKDGKLAFLTDNDYVITNNNGSSDIAATGNIKGGINHMIATGNPSYKYGKLPKHAEGWLGNFIPSAIGSLAGLDQMYQAYRNKPFRPNTYVDNPYETEGLTTLAGLRVNPYPIMNQLRNAEARTNRAIDIAGGLSGAQRTAARLANLNTTQNNISKLLSDIQQLNNAYRANYAQAAINAGQASRQARMAASQWDLDYYSKAHAARNRGIQTGIANMLSQIQQYQANEFKRRQFNDTMDLYRADQKQRKEEFDWIRNNTVNLNNTGSTTRGVGADPTINNPVAPMWGNNVPTYFGTADPFGINKRLEDYRKQYNTFTNSLPAWLKYGGMG